MIVLLNDTAPFPTLDTTENPWGVTVDVGDKGYLYRVTEVDDNGARRTEDLYTFKRIEPTKRGMYKPLPVGRYVASAFLEGYAQDGEDEAHTVFLIEIGQELKSTSPRIGKMVLVYSLGFAEAPTEYFDPEKASHVLQVADGIVLIEMSFDEAREEGADILQPCLSAWLPRTSG